MLFLRVSQRSTLWSSATLLFLFLSLPLLAASLDLEHPHRGVFNESPGESEPAVYIVQLEERPLATYDGRIPGLAATSPRLIGQRKLDVDAPASRAYESFLADRQAAVLASIQAELRRELDVRFQYRHAYNGLAVVLSPAEAARVAQLHGVVLLYRESDEQLLTDTGPAFIGAPAVWQGLAASKGEGVIIGVIDTGINSSHPSFAAVAGDGYVHTNPYGVGNYVGFCVANPSFCNAKLIGAWALHPSSSNPEDSNGHGSHTAATAAGNELATASLIAPTQTYTFDGVSGVAPRANIIAYEVCVPSCPTASTTAAVNQAVIDGVDVTNYSISGGSNPYVETTAVAFRNAAAAGLIAVNSAGNSGPGPATVGHQGPWIMTVAASTHDRAVLNELVDLTSSGASLPPILGEGPTAPFGPAPMVYAGDAPYNNPLCNPFPANTFSGQIVVCDRGVIARVAKGQNVLDAGGGGMVLLNDAPSAGSLNADTHVLPATHISYADGLVLKAWMAANADPSGRISGGVVDYDASYGDAMASFSSRGPAGATVPGLANLIKPDVSAPGLNILAAYFAGFTPPPSYNIISGTSMSSPHAAGAAALVRALQPDWSPAEVKSALMMTSIPEMSKEDLVTPADPFDFGAGRVSLLQAAEVGFVLNVSNAEYLAANPTTGGDPGALNLPSMARSSCPGGCSWTRQLRSVLDHDQSYTAWVEAPGNVTGSVSPASFVLEADGEIELTISVNVSAAALNSWHFARVHIVPDPPASPEGIIIDPLPSVSMPIAARATPGIARIEVEPETIAATLVPGGGSVERVVQLANVGFAALDWELHEAEPGDGCAVSTDLPWLSAAPLSGSLPSAEVAEITVTLGDVPLAIGDYTGLLCVQSNDPDQPMVPVQLQLRVADPDLFADRFEPP